MVHFNSIRISANKWLRMKLIPAQCHPILHFNQDYIKRGNSKTNYIKHLFSVLDFIELVDGPFVNAN